MAIDTSDPPHAMDALCVAMRQRRIMIFDDPGSPWLAAIRAHAGIAGPTTHNGPRRLQKA